MGDLICESCEAAAARARGDEKWIVPPWKRMEWLVGGSMRPGLWVHASGSGTGKTQFAMELAISAASNGSSVYWFDLENGSEVTGSRVVGLLNNIPWGMVLRGKTPDWYDGNIEDAQYRAMMQAKDLDIRFCITSPGEFSELELNMAMQDLKTRSRSNPALIVIDYVQIAALGFGEGEMRTKVASLVANLRRASNDHGVLVWAISSVAREKWMGLVNGMKEGRGGASPLMEPFRTPAAIFMGVGAESSGIEFSADAVITSLPGKRIFNGSKIVPMALAKQRDGMDGWMNFEFDGLRFHEIEVPHARQL